MNKENIEKKEEKVRKPKVEKKNKKGYCRGSYIIGTACAKCKRCEKHNFTAEIKAEKIEAETERTKNLPASRVKRKQ